eukprot:15340238-Ditylum_brightwellii.AAC.1
MVLPQWCKHCRMTVWDRLHGCEELRIPQRVGGLLPAMLLVGYGKGLGDFLRLAHHDTHAFPIPFVYSKWRQRKRCV